MDIWDIVIFSLLFPLFFFTYPSSLSIIELDYLPPHLLFLSFPFFHNFLGYRCFVPLFSVLLFFFRKSLTSTACLWACSQGYYLVFPTSSTGICRLSLSLCHAVAFSLYHVLFLFFLKCQRWDWIQYYSNFGWHYCSEGFFYIVFVIKTQHVEKRKLGCFRKIKELR